ncbi:MAG: hypothetical protein HKP61_10875, partial [Dactylosporangium sp.]|nr:hypothetical protein [Dactylosporangium sp.]NNJ61432.1 hypothetical protein [Dactylosporangium sp.]
LCLAALLAYTLGSGPSRANSPEGVVDRYLTAFKDDDLASLRKSSCRGDAPLLDRMDRPTSLSGGTWHLTSWDVVSTEVTDDRGYVRVTIRGAGEDGGQKAETTIFPALREEGTWMVCFSMS